MHRRPVGMPGLTLANDLASVGDTDQLLGAPGGRVHSCDRSPGLPSTGLNCSAVGAEGCVERGRRRLDLCELANERERVRSSNRLSRLRHAGRAHVLGPRAVPAQEMRPGPGPAHRGAGRRGRGARDLIATGERAGKLRADALAMQLPTQTWKRISAAGGDEGPSEGVPEGLPEQMSSSRTSRRPPPALDGSAPGLGLAGCLHNHGS